LLSQAELTANDQTSLTCFYSPNDIINSPRRVASVDDQYTLKSGNE